MVAIFKLFILPLNLCFEQGDLLFHFVLGPATHGPRLQESREGQEVPVGGQDGRAG